jgi:hypothetical protein
MHSGSRRVDNRAVGHVVNYFDSKGSYFARCRGCRWWCRKETLNLAVLAGEAHERQGRLVGV